ncbi:alpha/beta fold hydrolase [Denitromonas iodatirespirans]|uniref:Alpha/beta fold hydrolase n=1 Tax=Denitromonas iodatirespirans TaxID=2795389 RepID=A0A944D888_DENI1|nr:alpha/beta fold hydrolase [Denitromonas iodatirespirans]MBT0961640.1 alpha/beta fold hydrolase [Denitromonas iodatirespirans]
MCAPTSTPSPNTEDMARARIRALEAQSVRHSVVHDGQAMCWRRFGQGRPLVLIHGGHGSWMHWIHNIEALAGQAQVWLPELPGYGDSDAPAGKDLAAVLDPLVAGMEALFGAREAVDVVGFSFGALVAAHLASRWPGVRRLALLAPAGHRGARRPRGELRSWRAAAGARDTASLADIMRHNLAVQMLHAAAAVDALAVRIHTDSCLRTRFRSKEISRGGGLADVLDTLSGPLLLAWGEHDVTVEPGPVAAALTAGHPERRTVIVPDAGHWLQYEQPHLVNRLLIDWLGDALLET